jgi:hypothetical protein
MPYSPDLNPMEQFFAKLNAHRAAGARSLRRLSTAMRASLKRFRMQLQQLQQPARPTLVMLDSYARVIRQPIYAGAAWRLRP